MSIESVMPSNYLILHHPLLLLPSTFPRIRVFSNELALHIRWPKYWSWSFSFSISPSSEYSLEYSSESFRIDGLISVLSKDSEESSLELQFESINFLVLSHFYGPTLTSVHDYWKNYSFDYLDLYWQSDVSAF